MSMFAPNMRNVQQAQMYDKQQYSLIELLLKKGNLLPFRGRTGKPPHSFLAAGSPRFSAGVSQLSY
jgi:hypothetical protein